jgi:hypothetical protein
MADSNPVGGLFLLLLIVLTVWAIFGAKGAKWKLLNLLIIVAFVGVGLGLGYLAGLWSSNMAIGAHFSVLLATLLGSAAAYVCLRRNGKRSALHARPEPKWRDGPA